MELILVKTTYCGKCISFQPIFEYYCTKNNINHRVICYDLASDEDINMIRELKISAVPSLIIKENDFKQAYSDVRSEDDITRRINEFNNCKGV